MGWGAGGAGLADVRWLWRQMNFAFDDAHSLASHRPVAKPVAMETHPSPWTLTGIDNEGASVGEMTGRQKAGVMKCTAMRRRSDAELHLNNSKRI